MQQAAILLSCALTLLVVNDVCVAHPAPQTPQAASPTTPLYVGPGSCSAASCHGSVTPKTETRVLQNEYSTWVLKDKHARAYQALTTPVSQRMARILGLTKAETAKKCLACHALDVLQEQRGRNFELSEGVSCESCHGPASAWLGPHTTRNWPHEESAKLGMFDTKKIGRRAERCLSCHLGTAEKFVDHEMIAAGHPDLYFELDSFSAVMPAHWKEPHEKTADEREPWHNVRVWAAGQAIQLREGLLQLERRARSGPWPEFAEMQCYSCHHSLPRAEESWRQERGYAGRRPGTPPWNESRWVVFRSLALAMDSGAAKQLDEDLARLAQGITRMESDRAALASTARGAADTADRLARQIESAKFDAAFTLQLQQRICADADSIAGHGERAAEQAVMALDSLFLVYSRNVRVSNQQEVRSTIQSLFQQVDKPAAYNPNVFANQMRRVAALLKE